MRSSRRLLKTGLILLAGLTLLAVGLHWWRMWRMASAPAIPPTIRIYGDSGSVASLVFSPEGDELFVAAGGTVEVYDPATGRKRRSWKTGMYWITHLALSAGGGVAMTAGSEFNTSGSFNGAIKAWNLSKNEKLPAELNTIAKSGANPSAVALSPDGTQLAIAWQSMTGVNIGNNIHVFDVSSGTEKSTCTGHTSLVGGLTFSPDGKTLISTAWDYTIRKWDMATGQQSASWPVTLTGMKIALFATGAEPLMYSIDGKSLVVAGAGNGFEIRDASTGSVRTTATIQADGVEKVAFSPDGTLVAAAGNTYPQSTGLIALMGMGGDTEGTAGIWDAATGKLFVTLQQNGPGIQSLAFSPDGKWIAVGDENGMISIWDVAEVLAQSQR